MAKAKVVEKHKDHREPLASAVLNFIIWGTGYIHNGKRLVLGIGLLFVWILSLLPIIYLGIMWYFTIPGLLFLMAHLITSLVLAYDANIDAKE
ncbi:MAG: hypothetical protein V1870_03705 [Candidatus Aenigmatarchaeota archaeon]